MNREKLKAFQAEWGTFYAREARRTEFVPTDLASPLFYVMALLNALLEEEGGPDAGRGVSTAELFKGRLVALEIAKNDAEAGLRNKHRRLIALEEKADAVAGALALFHGSLKALEDRLDALTASDVALTREQVVHLFETLNARLTTVETRAYAARQRLETFRGSWTHWGDGPMRIQDLREFLDVLLGPPDVGQLARARSNDEFATQMRSGQDWPMEPGRIEVLKPQRGAWPCKVCGSYVCTGDVDPRACDQRAAARQAHP